MEIRQVQSFVHVARLGSFSRAAETMGYSQSAITVQIRLLEEELGTKLFDRMGKKVSLTPQGKRFLEHASRILYEMNRTIMAMNEDAKSDIKLTGLGLPSEMKNYMPATADDDEFSFVCPYMMLWDVSHLGASTAAIQMAVQNDGFDGSAGSTVDMEAWGEYEAETFTAEDNGDGGTGVLTGQPYVFYKDNMAEWVDKL